MRILLVEDDRDVAEVPRDRLIEDVWGDREISDNNLDAFIRLLRGKVDIEGQPAIIRTERGVGYALRSDP